MEQLPPAELAGLRSLHTRDCEYTGRSSSSPVPPKNSLEANSFDTCLCAETAGSPRHRTVCRYDQSSASLLVPYWPTAIQFPLLTAMAIVPPAILNPKMQIMRSIPFRSLSVDKSKLETLRLEVGRRRFGGQGYSTSSIHSLVQTIMHQTGSRSPYQHARYLFSNGHLESEHVFVFRIMNISSLMPAAGYSINTV
ncbi:hypothetical protein NQZ79_g3424 [Umbelopsis isabellina]|nr:hypothetical protein NQZ79_g3424 [Umbelopsis isabellina]